MLLSTGYDEMKHVLKVMFLPFLVLFLLTSEATGRDYPLLDAVRQNDVDSIDALLDKGYDVNTSDRNGSTALSLAAGVGKTELVKLLIKRGATLDPEDFAGWTPLMKAAFFGHKETVKAILEAGANADMALAKLEAYPSHYSDAYKAKAAKK